MPSVMDYKVRLLRWPLSVEEAGRRSGLAAARPGGAVAAVDVPTPEFPLRHGRFIRVVCLVMLQIPFVGRFADDATGDLPGRAQKTTQPGQYRPVCHVSAPTFS